MNTKLWIYSIETFKTSCVWGTYCSCIQKGCVLTIYSTGKVLFSKLGQPFGFPCDFSHFVCPLTSIKEDQEICAAYAGKHKGIDSLLQHAVIAIVPTPKHDP